MSPNEETEEQAPSLLSFLREMMTAQTQAMLEISEAVKEQTLLMASIAEKLGVAVTTRFGRETLTATEEEERPSLSSEPEE